MPTIELGDLRSAPAAGPPRRAWGPRRVVLAALAVLCLLAVTGAERPGPSTAGPRWGLPIEGAGFLGLGDGAAYLQRRAERTTLEAYELATGARRWVWTTELAGISVEAPGRAGGPLLVLADPEPVFRGAPTGAERTTIALDTRAGAELWRRAGQVHSGTADGVTGLLTRYAGGSIVELQRIRLADGAPIWRLAVPPIRNVVLETGSADPRLVTASATGEVSVLRYADGAHLTGTRLRDLTGDFSDGRYAVTTADRGRLIVFRRLGHRAQSAVHDLTSLREQWHTESGNGWVADCGTVVCGMESATARAYDVGTGRELWRRRDVSRIAVVTEERMLISLGPGDGHLLVESRSGRQIGGRIRGWLVSDNTDDASRLLLRPSRQSPGSALMIRLDLRTGAQRLIGSAGYVPDQQRCTAERAFLACVGRDRLFVSAAPR